MQAVDFHPNKVHRHSRNYPRGIHHPFLQDRLSDKNMRRRTSSSHRINDSIQNNQSCCMSSLPIPSWPRYQSRSIQSNSRSLLEGMAANISLQHLTRKFHRIDMVLMWVVKGMEGPLSERSRNRVYRQSNIRRRDIRWFLGKGCHIVEQPRTTWKKKGEIKYHKLSKSNVMIMCTVPTRMRMSSRGTTKIVIRPT